MQAVKLQVYCHMAYSSMIILVGRLHVKDGLLIIQSLHYDAHIISLPAGHMTHIIQSSMKHAAPLHEQEQWEQ